MNARAPEHQHRKEPACQLPLLGGVTCRVPSGMWMVPPHCGVWVPGACFTLVWPPPTRAVFLFIEPRAADLPNRCCTLSCLARRELIIEIADQSAAATADLELMETLLLSALSRMPVEHLHLPLTDEPRLAHRIELADDPSNRSTVAQWAKRVAMVRIRSSRLVQSRKRALPFGRWRRQQLQVIVAIRSVHEGNGAAGFGDLGYQSVSTFITMFKKALGTSPADIWKPTAER